MAIDGNYNVEISTPMGKQKGKYSLKTEGSVVTGTATTPFGTDQITDGTVDGNTVKFKINSKSPFGPMKLDITLTVDGDKISGQSIMQPMGMKSAIEGTREV